MRSSTVSIRSRLALLAAAGLLVFAAGACGGSTSSQSASEIARTNVCTSLGNLGDSLTQFQGVDIAAIGVENLAPQINNVIMSWTSVKTSLTAFAAAQPEPAPSAKLAALETAWFGLEAALKAIPTDAPTQESVDAAKAAAGEFRTAYTDAFGELNCVAATPAP
jgi:hypothetical protein